MPNQVNMNRLCGIALCAITIVSSTVIRSSATPVPADQHVTVKHVRIEGADRLSAAQIEQVKSSVLGKPESMEVLMDTARHLLHSFLDGYCYIRSDIQLSIVNASASPDNAWMQVTVQQGIPYRLHNFSVNWATVFSAQEIGQHLPLEAMRRGDCAGLESVESRVADLYKDRGFRNVKVHSLVQANKAAEQFDLTLYIDENK